ESEINKRKSEAKEIDINLHIWKKKEIENYLLSANAIHRILILKGVEEKVCDSDRVALILDQIAESLKDDVIANYANEIQRNDKKLQAGTAYKRAKQFVDEKWSDKLSLIPGKTALTELNKILKEQFDVAISINHLAQEINISELDSEIIEII